MWKIFSNLIHVIIKSTVINILTIYNDILLVWLLATDSVKLMTKLHQGKMRCVRHNLIKEDRHLLDIYSVQRNCTWCSVGKLAFMWKPEVIPIMSGKERSSHLLPERNVSLLIDYMCTWIPKAVAKTFLF